MGTQSACGNLKCAASSGIDDRMTFGSGYLDPHGYWEFPCRACAEAWDANREQHKKDVQERLFAAGQTPQQVELYMQDAVWLNEPAWPEVGMDIERITRSIQNYRKREQKFDGMFENFFGED